jgi:hypothetical protein
VTKKLGNSACLPEGVAARALIGLVVQSLVALLSGAALFFLASWTGAMSGVLRQLSFALYGVFVFPAMATYFYLWRLLQVGWNVRFRDPVFCQVQLQSNKTTGLDRGTVVFLVEIGKSARFGRTAFAWSPMSFLGRGQAYVYQGRYPVMISVGRPPLASTLRIAQST